MPHSTSNCPEWRFCSTFCSQKRRFSGFRKSSYASSGAPLLGERAQHRLQVDHGGRIPRICIPRIPATASTSRAVRAAARVRAPAVHDVIVVNIYEHFVVEPRDPARRIRAFSRVTTQVYYVRSSLRAHSLR